MQELFLFGQIDDSRHAQLLSILSGLTAAKPRPSLERHVLFKPIRAPNQDITRGVSSQAIATKPIVPSGAGNKEVFHIRLVKSLQPTEFGTTPTSIEARTGWTQRFYDTPDPVQRSAGLRTIRDVGTQGDDPLEAITGSGYVFVNQYITEGHEFVFDNVVMQLYRMRRFPDPSTTTLDVPLPQLDKMPLVDPSRSWLLQLSVSLVDGADPKLVAQGLNELEAMRNRLKGVASLSIPERLSMDTRAR